LRGSRGTGIGGAIVLAPVGGDPRVQESALRPLIITTVDSRGRIREVLHIEKHEAACDLCGSLIALTKRELEERIRGEADMGNGVQDTHYIRHPYYWKPQKGKH